MSEPLRILAAGGAGFIGSAFCRQAIARGHAVLVFDALTYAGDLRRLAAAQGPGQWRHVHADICNAAATAAAFSDFQPDIVVNFAAETHVDRSLDNAAPFIQTNAHGAWTLAHAALNYWRALPRQKRNLFRFLHLSTDEVFGALSADDAPFTEQSPYAPRSPYAASKAAGDHLLRALAHSFGFPVQIAHPGNAYGPYQFPEKLIPLSIINALNGAAIRVYGDGLQRRDWIHVDDLARGLFAALECGAPTDAFVISAGEERRNIDVVNAIARALDRAAPQGESHARFITYVEDRPGHDFRYASDSAKLHACSGWRPEIGFDQGLDDLVSWHQRNEAWWRPLRDRVYAGERLGRAAADAAL